MRIKRREIPKCGLNGSGAHGGTRPTVAAAFALLMAILITGGFALASNQKPPASTVRGFQAPLEYFDPPHELQMKSFLEGAQADPGADGVIIIQDAKLQTYREDGTKEMLVKAPQCIFDSRRYTVSSAGPFQMQTSNVMVQGVGFFWKQTNSELLISNQQVTTVTGQMTNSFTP